MNISSIVSQMQMFNPFHKKGSVLGIDIGTSSIKIIELIEKRGKLHLLKYGTLSLGPFANKDIGIETKISNNKLIEAIKTAMTAIDVKARKGGIAIPLRLSLIVTIEVPAEAEDKLDTVIPLEARRYIPMPPSEVNIAWSVISNTDAGSLSAEKNKTAKKIKVLVAAIHNNTFENFQEIAKKSEITPAIFEIETFSTLRSVFGQEQGTFALLDIGASNSKVLMIDYGSITVSHTINKGSQSFTQTISNALSIPFSEAEKQKRKLGLMGSLNEIKFSEILKDNVNYIFDESSRVMENFERNNNKKIEKVVLIGGGVLLKGIVQHAKHMLDRDVFLGNPFKNIELPTPVLEPVLQAAGPEFAVSVGLAIRAVNEI